jgi:hypothetical protein
VSRDVLKVAAGDHEGLSLPESPCRAVVCPIRSGRKPAGGVGQRCAPGGTEHQGAIGNAIDVRIPSMSPSRVID